MAKWELFVLKYRFKVRSGFVTESFGGFVVNNIIDRM